MKNILVLTDFSKCANNAVRYAIRMAEMYDIHLVFYHSTYQYFLTEMPESYILKTIQQTEKDHQSELKKNISEIYKSLNLTFKNAKFIARYAANVTENIEALIKTEKIDMILMGTKGASGLSRVLFGSNTTKVIDQVSCPVLSIPESKRFRPFKKIILFTDLTDLPHELIDIIPLVKYFNCQLEICHLDENVKPLDPSVPLLIEEFKVKYKHPSIKLRVIKRIFEINLVSQIETITAASKPDMICMHTLKYNWLEKLLSFSFTKDLLFHSKTSILTFSKKLK